MGPSFQRMIESCFPQKGYVQFKAAFWSIRMSWRLGSWDGLRPRQWKVFFTVSVSQSTLGLPCLRYGGFCGTQVWFSKMACRRGKFASARRMWPNRLILLSLQKSESFWTYTPCVFAFCSTTWLVCALSMKVDGILRIRLSPSSEKHLVWLAHFEWVGSLPGCT